LTSTPISNGGKTSEGLKAFLSLSFPRVILGKFGKKPFPEFLKAFPDLERDLQNLSCYF